MPDTVIVVYFEVLYYRLYNVDTCFLYFIIIKSIITKIVHIINTVIYIYQLPQYDPLAAEWYECI